MKQRIYADVKVDITTENIHKKDVVYCLTFPNGKRYIGITTQKFEQRIKEHIWESFDINKPSYNTKKGRAIRKYLKFMADILYQGDNLQDWEIFYINEYDTMNNGYNSTLGGENINYKMRSVKAIHQYTLEGIYIQSYKSITEASLSIKGDKSAISTISAAAREIKSISAYNYRWSFKKVKQLPELQRSMRIKKSICQYDNDENIIGVFSSMLEASLITGIGQANISGCCNGKQKTAGGYIWRYEEE